MFISPRHLVNIENKGQHPSLQIFFELIQRYHISVHQFQTKSTLNRKTPEERTAPQWDTQYRKEDWIRRLGEGVQAEAVVDRYAYTAFWIETGSMNMREYFAKNGK